MSGAMPVIATDVNAQVAKMMDLMRAFAALTSGMNDALGAQKHLLENPISILKLALDDARASAATGNTMPRPFEINIPHQSLFVHDSNSQSAYFWYRPFDRDDNPYQWIKMQKGKQLNFPFPVKKAYIWYPSQDLLTIDLLFFKYGQLQSPEVQAIVLNTTSGSSTVTAFMGTGSDTSKAVTAAAAVAVLPAQLTRAKAWLFNDGDGIWIGDSNVAVDRGQYIGAGERFEWTNSGPLYAISEAGGTSTIKGLEERQ